ncbi:translocation/assembly module TamB domain-containing protein [Calditerrivibrio sp.]|uniref:translocation/assembly module TamB domain-containing protein n=1 Tax=Calditerrivibrio sp. TaxID=2792612 RepID=UPI003D09E457
MVNEKKGKTYPKIIIALIFFISLIAISINYAIQTNLDYLIKKYSPYEVSIEKVNKLFFPFYFDLKGFTLEVDRAFFKSDSVVLRFYPLRYLMGKSCLDIEISNIKADIPEYFWNQPSKKIDLSKLKDLKISSLYLNTTYNDIKVSLKTNSIFYRYGGEFSIPYLSGDFSKDEIKDRFIGRIKLLYTPKSLKIYQFDLKGENFFLQATRPIDISEGNKAESSFEGFIGENFVRMLNPHLKGLIKLKGDLSDRQLRSMIDCNLKYDDKRLNIKLSMAGVIGDKFKFSSDYIVFDNNKIYSEGFFDTKTKKVDLIIKFIDGYKLHEDDNWHPYLNYIKLKDFDSRNGKIQLGITSNEEYTVFSDLMKDDNAYILKNLVARSKTFSAKGNGVYDPDADSIFLDIEGELKNNSDIKHAINNDFYGMIKSKINITKDSIYLKGYYDSNIPQKIYGIETAKTRGEFDLSSDNISFTNISTLKTGRIKTKGFINFNTKKENYEVITEAVPFYEVMNFFVEKSDISYKISGKTVVNYSNGDYTGNVDISIDDFKFSPNRVKLSFKNSLMAVDEILLENNRIKPKLLIDFKRDTIDGMIKSEKIKLSGYPIIKNLNLLIKGKPKDPSYKGSVYFEIKHLENNRFDIIGNLNGLTFIHKSDKLYINGYMDIDNSSLSSRITLKRFNIDNISVIGDMEVSSNDLKIFEIRSSDTITILNSFKDIYINNLSLTADSTTIIRGDLIASSSDFKDLKVVLLKSDLNKLNGEIDLKDSKISIKHTNIKKIEGKVRFEYDFNSYPKLDGTLHTIFDVIYPDIKLKLKNIRADGYVSDKKIELSIKSNEISGKLESNRYYDITQYNGNLIFKDIFAEKRGFYGAISGNLLYHGGENQIYGEIFVDKSVFRYAKYEKNNSPTPPMKLPFRYSLKISTTKPVRITDGMLNGYADLNLQLKYEEKLKLNGDIKLINSYFTIQGTKFLVTKGVMKILNNDTIYADMEANGTDALNTTRIYVNGYIPDYRITIYDSKQKGDTYFSSSRNMGSYNLMSKIINDAIFKDIVKNTNRFFGINTIGIEPNASGGIFKVGRKFNDRIEVNYTTSIDENRNSKVGLEYTLFDWFKLTIFSKTDGGTGAGTIFSFDF